jgi:ribosome recycling factor
MNDWKSKMEKSVGHLAEQLKGIRPGTLSVGFIETFRVSSHRSSTALGKMAIITRQGDRILIRPFDQAAAGAIVKALADSKLNAYALDPTTVCVSIPPISSEQRIEITKHVQKLGEAAKVAVRTIRQEARKQIAARGRGSQRAVQEHTDAAIAAIEGLIAAKVAELRA